MLINSMNFSRIYLILRVIQQVALIGRNRTGAKKVSSLDTRDTLIKLRTVRDFGINV